MAKILRLILLGLPAALVLNSVWVRADTEATHKEPETLLGPAPPYTPRETDYSLELGLMSAKDDLFWSGALIGKHLGRCPFSLSESCQQFIDGLIGVAARESETQGHFLASLRWQYVNMPDRYSPYWRILGGTANVARSESRGWRGTGGIGVGVTTYLHEKVDLRLELRAIALDRAYYQAVIGMNIKVDRLLIYFAKKLRDLGYGTVETAIEATGTALKATGEAVGGVTAPFREKKKEPPAPEK